MRRIHLALTFIAMVCATDIIGQGPLTNALNLRMRTDASGYLISTSSAYTSPDGPLTALGNLRLRTDANGYLLTTFNGVQALTVNNIVTTSTDGLSISNTTPATAGVPVQMSPRLRWRGTAWDTAASETVDFFVENLPATAATPTGTWKLGYSLNGGAATYPMTVTSAGLITTLGSVVASGALQAGAANIIGWAGLTRLVTTIDGQIAISNNAQTIGSQIKADALPTVASGFGTTPGITAGSTPLAGSINIGTGGVATTGVINFNGTAFPSAPFCTVTTTLTPTLTRITAVSATQLTLTTTVAWTASDVVSWICISSK